MVVLLAVVARYLVDGLLKQREAFVHGIIQYCLQPIPWISPFLPAPCQRSSVQCPILDLSPQVALGAIRDARLARDLPTNSIREREAV